MKFIIALIIAISFLFGFSTLMIPIPIVEFCSYKYSDNCIIMDRIAVPDCNYAYNVYIFNHTLQSECLKNDIQYGTILSCYANGQIVTFTYPMPGVFWFLLSVSFVSFIILIICVIILIVKIRHRKKLILNFSY